MFIGKKMVRDVIFTRCQVDNYESKLLEDKWYTNSSKNMLD